jgi:hypothetical protein
MGLGRPKNPDGPKLDKTALIRKFVNDNESELKTQITTTINKLIEIKAYKLAFDSQQGLFEECINFAKEFLKERGGAGSKDNAADKIRYQNATFPNLMKEGNGSLRTKIKAIVNNVINEISGDHGMDLKAGGDKGF